MTSDTGLPSDQYKRAVLRRPPSRFTVEFLPTSKSNGSYNHGMHIAPLIGGDGVSVSSRGSTIEYEIWRRWEDCLFLQEALEQEYSRAAREKKVRLQQGKGVKAFNGMYKQDMASSWESLPPGPDPKSVVQDVHGHLPRLTKRGTLFRASQATIEQRQREIQNLIETLFSDDMPALIQEIRASTVVTDFFALWRRDYDQLDHSSKGARNSLSSSVFSSYFSDSNPTLSGRSSISLERPLKSLPKSPVKKPSTNRRSSESRPRSSAGSTRSSSASSRSTAASSELSEVSRYPTSSKRTSTGSGASDITAMTYEPRRRALSIASSDSSSTSHSDGSSDSGSTASTDPAIVDDAPYVFGHNPTQPNERPSSVLEVLPEERELLSKSSEGFLAVPIVRRPRASTMERKANRSYQIVSSASSGDRSKPEDGRSIRESWQTTSSLDTNANDIIEGLGFTLPNAVKENKFRASMASISTFMTTDSADAVIPNTPTTTSLKHTPSTTSSSTRMSTPVSLSDFEIYSDDGRNSILDEFPRPTSYIPGYLSDRPETPTRNAHLDPPQSSEASFDAAPSPTPTSNLFFTVHSSSDASRSDYDRPRSPTDTIATTFTTSTVTSSVYDRPPSPSSTIATAYRTSSVASSVYDRPPSPTSTIATTYTTSTITSSVSPGTLSLKAAHNDAIILLRVSSETSFAEVRLRLYNKFVGQEGVPLSQNFTVAFVPATQSPTQTSPRKDRLRSASVSSADRMELIFINSDADWEQITSCAGGSKLTLRILDPK
ncbi:hypothetical protein M413DRAFT_445979 [Hebeloma cylindrosporum]|uniref:PX domain-containing protein n=1 Tax=Hebeloma cylindrosporum TaxID=76867 RepID=A0A0C2YHI7_HEBCY|nr:hypothetical protein M413DRAFT_445979 [Hebeloma cylindrosporum h7]